MNNLFFKQSRWLVLSMVLLAGLSACSEQRGPIIPPAANDVLDAMRQHDDSIVQIKLLKCLRSNPFEGQAGNGPRYDQYDCQVVVERYDALLDQSFIKQQAVMLDLGMDGWQAQ